MGDPRDDAPIRIDMSARGMDDGERARIEEILRNHLPGYVLVPEEFVPPQARVYEVPPRDITPSLSELIGLYDELGIGRSGDPNDPRLSQSPFDDEADLRFYTIRSADPTVDWPPQVAIVSLGLEIVVGVA